MKDPNKLVSPQALMVYELIAEKGSLSALEISEQLGIFPNAVYRACKQLTDIGVVERNDTYPLIYSAVGLPTALGGFMITAQRDFRHTFGRHEEKPAQTINTPTISFIKNRTSLLAKTDRDVAEARHEIKFAVSGLEVPDSTVLAYRKARMKGVKIRALVQKRQPTMEKLEKWEYIGVEVRQADSIDLRLFIIDSRIAYITTYDESRKEQAFGIRFDYAPFAALLNDVFEQKWANASTHSL